MKLDDSWYGECVDCGKPVPRLKDKSGRLSEHCQDCGLKKLIEGEQNMSKSCIKRLTISISPDWSGDTGD